MVVVSMGSGERLARSLLSWFHYGTIPPNTVIMTIVNQRPLYRVSRFERKGFFQV